MWTRLKRAALYSSVAASSRNRLMDFCKGVQKCTLLQESFITTKRHSVAIYWNFQFS